MNNQKWMSRATQEEKAMAYDLLVVGGKVDEVDATRALRVASVALKRAPAPKSNSSVSVDLLLADPRV